MTDLEAFSVPWRNQADIVELDLGYYWHSAIKFVSPMVIDLIGDSESVVLTQQQRTRLAGMLYTIYHRKWAKLWGVYQSEYNPIENYSMVETETVDKDVTRQDTNTGTVNVTNTGTVNVANTGTVNDSGAEGGTVNTVVDSDKTNTGTQSNSGASTTQDGIFGFNSATSVGSDTSDNQNSNTRTDNLASTEDATTIETRNLTDSNQRTLNTNEQETRNTNEQETRNLASNGTENEGIERELTRSGNIGVTTSQQMLESEIALWQWNFFKQVFEDIDAIMCLPIY